MPLNKLPLVAPSLLAADLSAIAQELRSVEKAGARWIHLDVMDGTFVPSITFGTHVVAACKKVAPKLLRDVHLMIQQPERHIEAFAEAGAQVLTVHVEAGPHLYRTLQTIKAAKMMAGVAINPATPVESIREVLEIADLVLVMSVNPGWGGQKFISNSLTKIEQLASARETYNYEFLLEVDGGIDEKTAPYCLERGVDILVAGTAVFGQKVRKSAIKKLCS